MTDYIYSYSITSQTRLFLQSLGFGFLVGALYDFFRALRISFGSKKISYYVTDLLFLISLGFLNFLFFLTFNEGEIRIFALFGESLGFIFYIFSVGSTFIKYFESLICFIKRFLTAFVKVITFPVRKLFGLLNKLVKKYLKIPQKSKNKLKYPLKLNRRMLYNLTNRNQKNGKSKRRE